MTTPNEPYRPCPFTTLVVGWMLLLALGFRHGAPIAAFLVATDLWRRLRRRPSGADPDKPDSRAAESRWLTGLALLLVAWTTPIPWLIPPLPVEACQVVVFTAAAWLLFPFAGGWRVLCAWIPPAVLFLPALVLGVRETGPGAFAGGIVVPPSLPSWLVGDYPELAAGVVALMAAVVAGLVFAVVGGKNQRPWLLLAGCFLSLVLILGGSPLAALALAGAAMLDLVLFGLDGTGAPAFDRAEDRRGLRVFYGVLLGGFLLLCGILNLVVRGLPLLGQAVHDAVPVAVKHFKGDAPKPRPPREDVADTRRENGRRTEAGDERAASEEATEPADSLDRSLVDERSSAASSGLASGEGAGGRGGADHATGPGKSAGPGATEKRQAPETWARWFLALIVAVFAYLGWRFARRWRRRDALPPEKSPHALAGWCLFAIEELFNHPLAGDFEDRLVALRREALALRYGGSFDASAATRLAREVRGLTLRLEKARRVRQKAARATAGRAIG